MRARKIGFRCSIGAGLFVAIATLGCSEEADPDPKPRFRVVFEQLDEALVSVWGRSAEDMFAVGSDLGEGKGPLVLHYDGSAWKRLSTGSSGDLWWVFGFSSGPVLMGGADGRILRWQNGAFSTDTTPSTVTVFGIWGSSESDVWAVGGSGSNGAFAWRYDGAAWNDVPLPSGVRENASLFKVWGRGPDDVWLVGSNGTTLHYDGSAVTKVESGTVRPLFTVHDDGQRFTAVGGAGDGVIIENDGSGWKDATPSDAEQPVLRLSGVCTSAPASFAAGDFGSMFERRDGAWQRVELGIEVFDDFHATFIDASGGVWAVGGQVQSFPLTDGLMIHSGEAVPGGSYSE